MAHFPRTIASLITEDPNLPKDEAGWSYEFEYEHDELEDPELLEDKMYWVKYRVGANYEPGEAMVRHQPDGSGYPGSPSYWEWDILGIKDAEAYDKEGTEVEDFKLTPELEEKLIETLHKHVDDQQMQEMLSDDANSTRPAGPDEDDQYEQYRDRLADGY